MAALIFLFLLLLVAVIYYLKKKGLLYKILFKMAYLLYARTKLGYYYHQRKVKKSHASSPPHSKVDPVSVSNNVVIYPLPYLDDNYCYLIVNRSTQEGVAVDPAHANVLQKKLKEHNIALKGVLITHKHWDHAGGNLELKQMYPHLPIYGGRIDHPSAATILLNGNEEINICGLTFQATSTPGHTYGHMVYTLKSSTPHCVFTGDHLFIAGCGKIFEDSYDAMYRSLSLIKNMDSSSLIFPGHEYTWSNLQFAMTIDPQNVDLQEKYESVRKLRLKRYGTIPSTLYEELQYNPFLRTDSLTVKSSLGLKMDSTQTEVLTKLRNKKDQFKAQKLD